MVGDALRWRPMITAPRDGTRIVVVIRPSEQGPADIDVVRWGQPRHACESCWTSTAPSHDCSVVYDDWEVANWMPLPPTMPGVRTRDMASKLPAFPGDGREIGGPRI